MQLFLFIHHFVFSWLVTSSVPFMENNGHMELEHPSVWLIKQEVSRKPSNVVREAKDRTGKAIHDSRLQTSAGEHLTASDMAS